MAQAVGLMVAVAGGMAFLVSFIGFKPPAAMLKKDDDDDADADKDRETMVSFMRIMRWGFRILAALAAVIGVGIFLMSGGSFDNLFG